MNYIIDLRVQNDNFNMINFCNVDKFMNTRDTGIDLFYFKILKNFGLKREMVAHRDLYLKHFGKQGKYIN